MFIFYTLGEAFFATAIVFNFWAFLSPTPWHSNNPTNSMLKFVPYNEPAGYVPPNPCGSNSLSNETVSITDTPSNNAANYSNVAVWMGPFGSCSRDQDGATHCTQPSFSNPSFNMTYVQDNSVFYPANMQSNMSGNFIQGLTIWHLVLLALFSLSSLPYFFPAFFNRRFELASPESASALMIIVYCILIIAGITEFFINFDIGPNNISKFNSIDNFYDAAPCGQTRPLKSGILLMAVQGKMYDMMWVGWTLIYPIAGTFLLYRICRTNTKFADWVSDAETLHANRDVEKAAKKEAKEAKKEEKDAKKFRSKVEEEKERIRAVALEELKAEESNKAKGEEKEIEEKASTPDEIAPPYLELTSPKN